MFTGCSNKDYEKSQIIYGIMLFLVAFCFPDGRHTSCTYRSYHNLDGSSVIFAPPSMQSCNDRLVSTSSYASAVSHFTLDLMPENRSDPRAPKVPCLYITPASPSVSSLNETDEFVTLVDLPLDLTYVEEIDQSVRSATVKQTVQTNEVDQEVPCFNSDRWRPP